MTENFSTHPYFARDHASLIDPSDIFAAWSRFAKEAGEMPGKPAELRHALEAKGAIYRRMNKARLFKGVALLAEQTL